MDSVAGLLNLPLGTLVVLAAGYVGYRIAYIGHDGPHSPVDVIFLSFAFAALAKAVTLVICGWAGLIAAMLAAVAAAVIWRRFGAPAAFQLLRRVGISDHDRGRDVWESMMTRQDLKNPNRLVVKLKSGPTLMCSHLSNFRDAPLGPCLLGPDGSVAMYITHSLEAGETSWKELAAFDPDRPTWGYEMSFIPASEIARIDITRPA